MRLALLLWLTAVRAASALEPPQDFIAGAATGFGIMSACLAGGIFDRVFIERLFVFP